MPSKTPSRAAQPPPPRSATAAEKKARRQAARTPPPGWNDPLAQQQPLVSGSWLLRALILVVSAAFLCAYLTLCLLFYQGQWQVVFNPVRTVSTTPASAGMPYDEVRFDYTQTGNPQLAGWWIPASQPGVPPQAAQTVLFLHDGRGSLADTVAQLQVLHSLGLNIFAFDYRGFGNSIDVHPSESHVYEDAEAAWTYLTDIRHLDPRTIVLYGTGLGATIAAESAIRHPQAIKVILENPAPPALRLVQADVRTRLLPIDWLFRDRFEIIQRLTALHVDLTPQAINLINSGQPAASPILLSQRPPQDQKVLLLVSPTPLTDSRLLPTLTQFLTNR